MTSEQKHEMNFIRDKMSNRITYRKKIALIHNNTARQSVLQVGKTMHFLIKLIQFDISTCCHVRR